MRKGIAIAIIALTIITIGYFALCYRASSQPAVTDSSLPLQSSNNEKLIEYNDKNTGISLLIPEGCTQKQDNSHDEVYNELGDKTTNFYYNQNGLVLIISINSLFPSNDEMIDSRIANGMKLTKDEAIIGKNKIKAVHARTQDIVKGNQEAIMDAYYFFTDYKGFKKYKLIAFGYISKQEKITREMIQEILDSIKVEK